LKLLDRQAIKDHHSTGKHTMTATTEYVILVDEEDKEIKLAEKLLVHQQGLLHRAFSVFIFRTSHETQQIELLLQQRSLSKYHSPLLWTNTCCSHPRKGEDIIKAGERRLQEELGIATTLVSMGSFHYKAHFTNGLCENEIDHVLVGHVDPDTIIQIDPTEIHSYRWINLTDLHEELNNRPEQFTPWLAKALKLISFANT